MNLSIESAERTIPLDSAPNVRHIGGYSTQDGGVTSPRLIRGTCMAPLSDIDAGTLLAYGVETVIDLRGEGEAEVIPSGLSAHPFVKFRRIPLLSEANPPDTFQEGFELFQRYCNILQNSRKALLAVFKEIAEASKGQGKLLFHCHAGKDRTGLIAALLLGLAGIRDEIIAADYAETDIRLAQFRDILRENSGVPDDQDTVMEEVVSSHAPNMLKTMTFLKTEYGGVRNYLRGIGLSDDELDSILTMVVEPVTKS